MAAPIHPDVRIAALEKKVQQRDAEIAQMKRSASDLNRKLSELNRRLASLSGIVSMHSTSISRISRT